MISFLKSFIKEEKCEKKHYSHKEEEDMILAILSKFNNFNEKYLMFISYDHKSYENKISKENIRTVNKITMVPFYINEYDLNKDGEIVDSEKRFQVIQDNHLEDQCCDHGQFNNLGELHDHKERDGCTLTEHYKIHDLKIIKINSKYKYPMTYEFLMQNISEDTINKIIKFDGTYFKHDNINYIPDFRKLPFIFSSHSHKESKFKI